MFLENARMKAYPKPIEQRMANGLVFRFVLLFLKECYSRNQSEYTDIFNRS